MVTLPFKMEIEMTNKEYLNFLKEQEMGEEIERSIADYALEKIRERRKKKQEESEEEE